MAISDHVRTCPLFFELFDEEIEKIVKFCTVYTFEAGDPIVRDGADGSEIFVILEGEASVVKKTLKGPIHIQTLKTGDVFGEMVIVDEKKRSADIIARDRSYVLEIKYDDIFKLFKTEPKIFGLMMLNMSRLLAKRLRGTNQLIMNLQSEKQ